MPDRVFLDQRDENLPAHETDRRGFLRLGAAAGLAAVGAGVMPGCAGPGRRPGGAMRQPFAAPPMQRVRIGMVGVGGMGTNHVEQLTKIEGAAITAVCDIREEHAARAADIIEKAGHPRPALYTRGERDFERLCETEDLDLVFTATPWEWHVPVCLSAMNHGKHAATEVPAAYRADDCWALVETAEKRNRHCVMMENCCYDRAEMMCLNMVRKGLLGDVLHGEGAYMHDLRGIKFSAGGEGLWRRDHATHRNGNLYPTHGLGPVAQCMNVNRGDRFDHLVSMSGPSRGLQLWQAEHLAEDDPRRGEKYVLGDVNLTLIRTANGKTIYVVHDTNLPRPYSRIHIVQGTRGIFERYPDRVHVEGRGKGHEWESLDAYREEFEHPLWKSETVKQASGGHGGMDFLEDYRLIHCLRNGLPTDMDVYDAAAWSSLCHLSEQSVAKRSRSVDVPDYTRGAWKTREPLAIVEG
jgi:predicted dehydrogenase